MRIASSHMYVPLGTSVFQDVVCYSFAYLRAGATVLTIGSSLCLTLAPSMSRGFDGDLVRPPGIRQSEIG